MFEVETDPSKRLVKITCAQTVDAKEAERCAEMMPGFLAEVKPGFRLLVDLTRLELMEVSCAPHLARIMDLCNGTGVEVVVRVIPDRHKDIGLNIMSLFHYGHSVRIVTCDNLAEATNILAS